MKPMTPMPESPELFEPPAYRRVAWPAVLMLAGIVAASLGPLVAAMVLAI